jgi:thermitase
LPSIAISPLHDYKAIPCPPGTNQFIGAPCSVPALIPNPHALIDTYGHGTFVACQIACHGLSYNYYGVAPRAKVAMAKVFLNGGADTRDIAQAIRWGVIHRFPIISMSLGGNPDGVMEDAVKFALKHGVLVVAAAGNGGYGSLSYPAGYPGVISVAASDRWDHLASFSQYGYQSITAPGDWIYGIAPMHGSVINCGGLCTWPGTSMSTPEVAGALADLLSVGMTTWQARQALLHGARHWPGMLHYQYGAGILDVSRSLDYAHRMHWGRA